MKLPLGHVERIDEYRMARRVLMAEVSGGRVGWMVWRWPWATGMTVEAARHCAEDRKEWRALVHMWLNEFHEAIFAWACVLSDRPPVLWWSSPLEGWDAVTWCGWDKLWKGCNYWISRRRCQVNLLRGVCWRMCVCYLTWLPSLVKGESHGILLFYETFM